MSGYIGNIPTPQATQSRQSFTATAGQTTFATVGYTAGFLDVYLNGVHLLDGTDYTATNGSDIVLTVGAALDDVVEFVAYETFSVSDQSFTGTTTTEALDVTGTVTATSFIGDGAGLTNVVSTTTGAVGTYAWAAPLNSSVTWGSTRAGSSLIPGGFVHEAYSDARAAANLYDAAALSGTWRAMGQATATVSNRYNATLWLRIS